ncbi:MAG TPA: hypothetical protein VFB38_27610 [Chthonomonadaceae bacterium]|nr:hypothetical protein [Chthonomonadaceae bacterium]
MKRGITASGRWMAVAACLAGIAYGHPAAAHPMGNFSISHYARFEAQADRLRLFYALDLAEIPTVSERSVVDADRNGRIEEKERDAYLREKASHLRVTVNGRPAALEFKPLGLRFRPGAGNLDTMLLTMELTAALPGAHPGATYQIAYQDVNFPERTGWKEIVTQAEPGAQIVRSSVSATDISQGLTVYPTTPGIVPPQNTEAAFTVRIAPGGGAAASTQVSGVPSGGQAAAPNTPQDAFTQAIAMKQLTPGLIVLALGVAFVFGSFHALSPGHGKAMVAAYLVGARGTARHAAFLGAVVTLTHTIGVFALGLVTLAAAQYVVPERLYPILSALSGLAIVGIGLTLLRQRIRALRAHQAVHDHDHAHHHHHEHDPSHTHDHLHEPHHHDHDHVHGGVLYHDHGDGHYHSHAIPEDAPISFKTLLALGITGGALPCPSALVVMLGAIALHRVAFGLALIAAFSLGLAAVLTGIGLLVVYARGFLEKLPLQGQIVSRLPVVSAAIVTAIGLALFVRAVTGQF